MSDKKPTYEELEEKIFRLEKEIRKYKGDKNKESASEDRFRSFVSHIPCTLYLCLNNPTFDMVFLNDQVEKLTGYPKEEFLTHKKSFAELFYEDDASRIYEEIDKAVSMKRTFKLLYRIWHKNGDLRWVEEQGAMIHADRQDYLEGFIHDVTDRTQTEETLILFKESLENSKDAIGMSTPEGYHYYQNKAFTDLFGVIGDNPFVTYLDPQAGKEIFSTIKAGGRWNGEVKMYSKDKQVRDILIQAYANKDRNGKVTGLVGIHTDLTDRKQAQQALLDARIKVEESQMNYRNLFDNSRDGIVIITLEGKIVNCNPAYTQMLGYSLEELKTMSIYEYTPEKWHEWERTEMIEKRLLKHGYTPAYEKEYIRKDGTMFPVELTTYTFPEPGGKTLFLCGVVRDITERKMFQQELLNQKNFLRKIIDSVPVFIAVRDRDGIFTLANKTVAEAYWTTVEEMTGKSDADFTPTKEEVEKFRKDDLKVMDTKISKVISDESITLKDGTVHWLKTIKVPLIEKDGICNHVIAVAMDITELKQVQESLRENEEIFRQFMENSPIYVFFKDEKIRSVRLSRNYEKMLGKPLSELMGKNMYELFPSDFAKKIVEDDLRILKEGKTITLDEELNGRYYTTIKFPIHIQGKPAYLAGYTIDITERIQGEAALHNVQKLESLGILAGGIAHDFNNLLGGIFGYIDLALLESSPEIHKGFLLSAMTGIDRARALTQQLLTFAKGGAPIKKIERLSSLIQEAAQFALSGSSISCKFDIQENLWACEIDRNQIGQVIDNIVINAQQAMPGGGIIEITARNIPRGEKVCPFLKSGNYVKISIRDYGIGIPKEFLPRIFDPFYTTKPKGHGLGLATCFSIITRHEGGIEVESESGKGSIFCVYLPASMEESSGKAEKKTAIHKGNGIFLVMDDEDLIRGTLGKMLQAFGYEVVLTDNGKSAVDFFAAEIKANRKITGMIFDLTIPGGMGGKEAIVEIRKLSSQIPVFVSSGYGDDPVMANPQEYGFTASICKPFMLTELSKMLNNFMEK